MKTIITRQTSIKAAARTLTFIALGTFSTFAAFAAQSSEISGDSRSAQASFAGLDLSTPEGMTQARERLHQAARVACRRVADSLDLSHQANFVKCVDATLSSAMRQLDRTSQLAINESAAARSMSPGMPTSGQPVVSPQGTRTKTIDLSDLDLSTPDGAREAHERVHQLARKLCAQVEDLGDVSKQPNYVKCVDQSMAAAIAQAQELDRANRPSGPVAKN